jgi:hypothetical protein
MNFNPSWDTLLRPGKATDFFALTPRPPLDTEDTAFSPGNAWWLAEFARLAYRSKSAQPSRNSILQAVGLCERQTVDIDGIHGFLVGPPPGGSDDFGILVFRGTSHFRNWVTNLHAMPASWRPGGKVHQGFSRALSRAWKPVSDALDTVSGPLLYAGHSLGGALAILAASQRPPGAVYTFGSPRVGDRNFAETLVAVEIHRVVNQHDLVPSLPPEGGALGFRHVGTALHLTAGRDSRSPIEEERHAKPSLLALTRAVGRTAPRNLADHAPSNYVAALERLL